MRNSVGGGGQVGNPFASLLKAGRRRQRGVTDTSFRQSFLYNDTIQLHHVHVSAWRTPTKIWISYYKYNIDHSCHRHPTYINH